MHAFAIDTRGFVIHDVSFEWVSSSGLWVDASRITNRGSRHSSKGVPQPKAGWTDVPPVVVGQVPIPVMPVILVQFSWRLPRPQAIVAASYWSWSRDVKSASYWLREWRANVYGGYLCETKPTLGSGRLRTADT